MPTIIAAVTVGPISTLPGPPVKPDATNTGWAPTGVTLTVYPTTGGPAGNISASGTLTITAANITLDSYDFNCRIVIAAANVTIKRSRINGIIGLTGNSYGLIDCTSPSCSNPVFEDCEIVPAVPEFRWTSIVGHGYVVRRCNMYKAVDGGNGFYVGSTNPVNNLIEYSYIHGLGYFSPDPNHPSDSPVSGSHSDCYAGIGGSGHTLRFNTLEGFIDTTIASRDGSATGDILRSSTTPNSLGGYNAHYPYQQSNSACQFTQPATPVGSPVANVLIEGNWIDGGAYSINFGTGAYSGIVIINNRFGHNQRPDSAKCISVPNAATGAIISGNVYDDTGLAVVVQRY